MSIEWTVHATYDDGSGGYAINVEADNEAGAAVEAQLEALRQRYAFFQLSYEDKRAIGKHVRLGEWDGPLFDGLRDLRISIASVERVTPPMCTTTDPGKLLWEARQVLEYEMVVGMAPFDLVRAVRCKLDHGWQLLGAPMLIPPILTQAMVKYAT